MRTDPQPGKPPPSLAKLRRQTAQIQYYFTWPNNATTPLENSETPFSTFTLFSFWPPKLTGKHAAAKV